MQTGARIFDRELARVPRPDDIGAMIRARAYHPISRVKPDGRQGPRSFGGVIAFNS